MLSSFSCILLKQRQRFSRSYSKLLSSQVPFYYDTSNIKIQETLFPLIDDLAEMKKKVQEDFGASRKTWKNLHEQNRIQFITESNCLDGSSLEYEECHALLKYGKILVKNPNPSSARQFAGIELDDDSFDDFIDEHHETLQSINDGDKDNQKDHIVIGKGIKDYIDAMNALEVVEQIFEWKKQVQSTSKEKNISQDKLKAMHSLFLARYPASMAQMNAPTFGSLLYYQNHLNSKPGKYRPILSSMNSSGIDFVNPMEISSQMEQLIDFIESQIRLNVNPIILASALYFNLMRISPFVEGNGRCARAASNLLLLTYGGHFFLTVFPSALCEDGMRKLELKAIEDCNYHKSLIPMVEFVATSTHNTYKQILETLQKQN